MTSLFKLGASMRGSGGSGPFRFIKGLFILAFTLIQAVLVARILLDIGVIPAEGTWGEFIISNSDTLAAPVQGVGSGLSPMFGGGALDMIAGEGLNGVMIVALAGWSVSKLWSCGWSRSSTPSESPLGRRTSQSD